MNSFGLDENPLDSNSAQVWDDLIEAVDPASLLVLIEQRMGPTLKSQCSADDLLQEALLHAWRDRHACQWEGLRRFRAWLISVIDHRIHDAADHFGALKRGGSGTDGASRRIDHGPMADRMPMVSTTPSRIAIYKEQAALMQEALAALPAELADVVRLRLFEQLPMESIASHLGLGVAAVRHRFRKGVELYQSRLKAAMMTRSGATWTQSAPPESPNPSSGM